jgi:hypothetical protein
MLFGYFKKNRPAATGDLSIPNPPVNDNSSKTVVDVTILINVWKRHHLEEQLIHLLNQSVSPKEIWIIQYEDHVDVSEIIRTYRQRYLFIHFIRSDKNLKYFGRFTIAVNTTTTFVWVLDDDVIPGEEWLEKCVTKCNSENAIICSTGRIIPKNNYRPEELTWAGDYGHYVGDAAKGLKMNYCESDTVVDYGCHSYFFKSSWMKAYWSVWPASFLSGEDIHLSASCKVAMDVNTLVLSQLSARDSGNLKKSYGWDNKASWRKKGFVDIREQVIRCHVHENKWTPILWK